VTRLAAIALLVVAALSYNLTGYPLLDPDEGRNAEVAREMAATGDYLHPRLDGLPYPDKPVVFFAATAAFVRVLGPTELAVRLPPLLFTLATLTLLWWAGKRLFGAEAGWIAAIIAGASPLTLGFARTVIMDSALTLFVTAAVIGFHETIGTVRRSDGQTVGPELTVRPSDRPAVWSALAWISMALGVLTKGPVALALPLMVVVPYAAWRRRLRALFDPVGLLAFVAIVLPWVRSMSDTAPGFLHHALVTETFLRLTTPALERTGPWWYFVPILLAGSLPWTAVLLGAWKELGQLGGWAVRRSGGQRDPRIVFLLLWILIPLVFFSLSHSKRPQYVLPLVPPIALLVGGLWRLGGQAVGRFVGVGAASASLGLIGLSLIFGHAPLVSSIRGMTASVAEAAHPTAFWLGAICVAASALARVGRSRLDMVLVALSLPVVAIPFISRPLMREIGRDRSAADLAHAILESAPRDAEVVGVGVYPPSLPFYLRRLIIVATADGRELTSNYLSRSVDVWRRIPGSPLRPADWWRDALHECDRPRVFVTRANDSAARTLLSGQLPLIAESRKYVVYGPCGRVDLAVARLGGWAVGQLENARERPTAQPLNRSTGVGR